MYRSIWVLHTSTKTAWLISCHRVNTVEHVGLHVSRFDCFKASVLYVDYWWPSLNNISWIICDLMVRIITWCGGSMFIVGVCLVQARHEVVINSIFHFGQSPSHFLTILRNICIIIITKACFWVPEGIIEIKFQTLMAWQGIIKVGQIMTFCSDHAQFFKQTLNNKKSSRCSAVKCHCSR